MHQGPDKSSGKENDTFRIKSTLGTIMQDQIGTLPQNDKDCLAEQVVDITAYPDTSIFREEGNTRHKIVNAVEEILGKCMSTLG